MIGADLCHNSLKLGHGFKRANQLERVHFLQMNLFRPPLKHGAFDLVISNGVLHHTADPFLAFREISRLVRPGGYILVGLYHRYGRLVTDLRRAIFRFSAPLPPRAIPFLAWVSYQLELPIRPAKRRVYRLRRL